MGIPHLTRHLSPYAIEKTLGCSTADCTEHGGSERCKIVIDGPALAYHIYYRLLAHKPSALNALEAQPSYNEVGKATLLYLDELASHKIIITRIFFDGFLPPQKRDIRISRLQSSIQQLVNYNAIYPAGPTSRKEGGSQDPFVLAASMLFDSSRPTPSGFRGLPTSPFIVSAVLDALAASQYADGFEIVPGEADVFCADSVRRFGGTVLTGDSDLLVHDLSQHGSVAFFSQLELYSSEETGCHVLRGFVSSPKEIADRLGLDGLARVAFEIQSEPSKNFNAAVKDAKKPLGSARKSIEFETFSAEYSETGIAPDSTLTSSLEVKGYPASFIIDPRISELALQSRLPREQEAHVYLPFLIEDPQRVSGWNASSKLRRLAYSFLLNSASSTRTIHEHSRKGFCIVSSVVKLLELFECETDAEKFKELADDLRGRLSNVTGSAFWRVFAMVLVMSWYSITQRRLPLYDTVTRVLFGVKSGNISWEVVHLSAQHQGVIYSIRLMKQILSYLVFNNTVDDKPHVAELLSVLKDLPPLNALLPSSVELQKKPQYAFYAHAAMEAVKEFMYWNAHLDEVADTGGSNSASNEVPIQIDNEGAWAVKESRRSRARKRKHAEDKSNTANSVLQTNNLYSILAQNP